MIFTADDFGLCADVNEAVERGHRDGVLSAASLMVGAPGAADAVARARRLPGLNVGLHLTLVDGIPTLPPEHVPALIGHDGRLPDNLSAAGVRWFFVPAARRQLQAEIRAQFDAFRATGLALDHVNAHHHMHLHPTVLSIILSLAREFGVRAIRLPYEPPAGALTPWLALMRARLNRAGLRFNDRVVGLHASGRIDEGVVLRALESLPPGVTEFYFHPGAESGELATLTSAEVRARLKALGFTAGGFRDIP